MKKVMRIVKAIREGRYHKDQPTKKKPDIFLLWGEDDNVIGHDPRKNAPPPIPAPKLPPPGHAASYNPPAEYLLTDEEKKAWEAADPSDR
jgi:ribosome biogenesis protein ERB1